MIHYIDEAAFSGKRVLVRVDYNVTLSPHNVIGDDARIRASLPTIEYLLAHGACVILMSHLGRPKGRDMVYSLRPVRDRLASMLPSYNVILIDDLEHVKEIIIPQEKTIYLLENLRFWEGEKKNDPLFAKQLAALADVYVNDAFGSSHRSDASIVGVPALLPSYGGMLLKKEIMHISRAVSNPEHPVVAIIGGAKIETKLALLNKLIQIADTLILGGAVATEFMRAKIPLSGTRVLLPDDVIVGNPDDTRSGGTEKKVEEPTTLGVAQEKILDIGPETQAKIGAVIAQANTIIWNGPMGYIENPQYRRGTDYLYYAITQNDHAVSIVGGGDTLAAISKKEYLDHITHISTGGGAMLEFIERGTLPGIDALNRNE